MNLIWIFQILGWLTLLSTYSYATLPSNQQPPPPDKGFFSLPGSQLPGPFFTFGQNIIDKNQWQGFGEGQYSYSSKSINELVGLPSIIYGLSDKASFTLITPFIVNNLSLPQRSSGFGDATLQGEYAFYEGSTKRSTKTATVVVNATLPTGSYGKQPSTGLGSPSFFLGSTYNRTFADWFWFLSPAFNWTMPHDRVHLGNNYFYQAGWGRNIVTLEKKYIFSGLVEVFGEYSAKDSFAGRVDGNTGGNTVYIGPSLWFSTDKITLQMGVALPVVQNLFGDQEKVSYMAAGSFGWTFG